MVTRTTGARLHIGTSGWSYPHWKGCFYPPQLGDDKLLQYYAGHFRSAEINTSFYRLPSAPTLRRWLDATPNDFVFAAKASRYITHMKKLRDARRTVGTFLHRIGMLGEKLGPILFQLPPHWHCDRERLATFLDSLSGEFRYAFEFRDPDWLNDDVFNLLAKHNIALCIYELDGFLSPATLTADLVYVRLHGPDGPYQGCYDQAALSAWAGTLNGWQTAGYAVYCYFDNDEQGYAASNAAQLQTILQHRRSTHSR